MPDNKDPSNISGIEALYRAHGDAEPDAGLDRIVRAKAEQALQTSKQRRPAPWIAGLATAGVLVLTVGVILQQTAPPTPEAAPSTVSAPASKEAATSALRSAPMGAPAAQPQASARARPEVSADSAFVTGLAETAAEPVDNKLLEIQTLLDDGQTSAAKNKLEQLIKDQPELDIPEELRILLDTDSE